MRLWRISAYPGLSGIGGQHVNGRWHTMPRAVIYAAEHPALAILEGMAHMRLSLDNIPTTLKLIEIELLAGAMVAPPIVVAEGWQANEPTTQTLGNRWLDGREALALPVPSAIVPASTNYLINTTHATAASLLREVAVRDFWFDKRYLR